MNQRIAILLMVCAISPTTFAKAAKQKRLLQDLSGPVLSVAAGPTTYYHPAGLQPQGYFAKPLPTPATSYLPKSSLGNIYKNYFEYSNYGSPFQFISGNNLGLHDEETYIADGRILKQYAVMEHHPEEVERNRLLELSHSRPSPAFASPNFDSLFDSLTLVYPTTTVGINPRFGIPIKERSPLLTTNHGPIALGSGSLGYIIGPNGVSIGSGSLGYISHQQHRETLADILSRRNRKLSPGPLHFGHAHD
ncbi:uncharacterized protein LOC129776325 [Toxorhynchites rutilus septentrionalis]|uniref:uncharacterized protein LOC129776325 n=1 Tax=Toxorhynchites rutilus septentrionalis TaxID=329112 RepID=UPI0024784543|nr:uncharacterized protein LOC129776325 [Toxorhynchites rutilus septentrionalis]